MLGIRFIKVPPTTYLLQYVNGSVKRQGAGLAFYYFAPSTTLVAVPVGSVDVPFIFEEVSADFQDISLQGQLTYRVADAQKLASLLNFSLDGKGREYASEDPQKLAPRLVNRVQVLIRAHLKDSPLREALNSADSLVHAVQEALCDDPAIAALGLEILSLSIQAIKPTPETARALEAEVREQLLQKADEAIYTRRNASVEQERAIRENELNTEIAVENKQRQIGEAQMNAKRAVQEKQWDLDAAEMQAKIALEQQREAWVEVASKNQRAQADTQAYALSSAMKALAGSDSKVIQALASMGMEPGQLVALAFRELADSSTKIGQLNLSPDLLRELLDSKNHESQ